MSEAKNTRSEVLAIAGDLINGDRQAHYGTPQDNFGTCEKGTCGRLTLAGKYHPLTCAT